jgi:hypothetical protein
MENYEKLGTFYLGKGYDLAKGKVNDELVLYDSKDLTTHGVIIGMTGSGKTGLGISLLEEALIDNIPVIAIDPKGDLPNLLLNFPDLAPGDFAPWVNPSDAANQGQTLEQFATSQAALWKKGLASWGQGPERIARLKEACEMAVYTPGSNAGLPVSLLRNFDPPSPAEQAEADLWREKVAATASSILSLVGIDADPITSREHVLVSNILESVWKEGQSLDLAGLIRSIAEPPFSRVGVMDLDAFYPPKERFALSMRINNLLAAPGFEAWLQGEPLDIARLLYTPAGKPRASIFCLSHLGDAERMFFVSMLLGRIISWMRGQPGTTSLRALLYFDEIIGYLPPNGKPPSKAPLLTLLKQARAFGLGCVLSTQNPVDLDYKALSNAGTWWLGRLQTQRDKERVLAGLEGAAAGGRAEFNKQAMDQILAGLGKRVFLLHNVHETRPEVFHVRWAMSYLRGPMTREQIKTLMADKKAAGDTPAAPAPAVAGGGRASEALPLSPQGVDVYYLPASGAGAGLNYFPHLLGVVEAHYQSARYGVKLSRTYAQAYGLEEGFGDPDWGEALALNIDPGLLEAEPLSGASFAELPGGVSAKKFKAWQQGLTRYVRQNRQVVLYSAPGYKLTSEVGESEAEFRARLGQAMREKRDLLVAKLRRRYESKLGTLERRLFAAQQAVDREKDQASASKMDMYVSAGATLLGALFGRKTISAGTIGRAGTTLRGTRRIYKEKADVERAEQRVAQVRAEMAELEEALNREVADIEAQLDPSTEELKEISISAMAKDLTVNLFGLAWLPYLEDAEGHLYPDWK